MTPLVSKSRSKKSKERARSGSQRHTLFSRHLFYALLIGFVTWSIVLSFTAGRKILPYTSLTPGQKAPRTLVAVTDFTSSDLAETELAREKAADAVPPVFRVNTETFNRALKVVSKLTGQLKSIRKADPPLTETEMVEELRETLYLLELPMEPLQAARMIPPGKEDYFLKIYGLALEEAWNMGIVSVKQKSTQFGGIARNDTLLLEKPGSDAPQIADLSKLTLPKVGARITTDLLRKQEPNYAVPYQSTIELSETLLQPNLIYQPQVTDTLRKQAVRKVETVQVHIPEGTILIDRGKVITPSALEQIRAHEEKLSSLETSGDRRLRTAGNGGLIGLALLLCGGLLVFLSPESYRSPRQLLLMGTLAVLTIAAAKLVFYMSSHTILVPQGLSPYLLPIGLSSLLASILINRKAALVTGLWTSLATAFMLNQDLGSFGYGLTAAIIGASVTRNVQRRSNVLRSGLWIGLGLLVYTVFQAALVQPSLPTLGVQAGVAVANGLVTALLALVLLPVFELLFGTTTDISLLEYSDLGHPLLQRLAKEAPGTYHHSLMVADLARAAATGIGANALLVRVCAYYHDIGKLTKPDFFIENQVMHANPHDTLAPSMSKLVILSHVKEGVTLAAQHKLPRLIIDGIRQHHGTSLISYFYHRAKKQKEEEIQSPSTGEGDAGDTTNTVSDSDFRYEGPKPQNREMAILMLSDSIEAASRSMAKPTHSRIEGLVKKIIEHCIKDGQLDECNLSLRELADIRESLIFNLNSMLHSRIEYPQDENRDQQPPDEKAPQPGKPGSVDNVALAAGQDA